MLQMAPTYMHQAIIRQRPSLVTMDQNLLDVVVRDAAWRYEENADMWDGFVAFATNYLTHVELLMSELFPSDTPFARKVQEWANLLTYLNLGK